LLKTILQVESIASLPWIEDGTLKVKLERREIVDVKTDYPQTVAKLFEMFAKLKMEGFASFI